MIDTYFNPIFIVFSLWFIWALSRALLRLVCSPITSRWVANGLLLTALTSALTLAVLGVSLMYSGLLPKEALNQVSMLTALKISAIGSIVSINLFVTPLFYWYDKRKSKKQDAMRIPENALHCFAFVGGTPGAMLCQRLFRHKSAKKKFRIVTWLSLIPTVCIYYLLLFGAHI